MFGFGKKSNNDVNELRPQRPTYVHRYESGYIAWEPDGQSYKIPVWYSPWVRMCTPLFTRHGLIIPEERVDELLSNLLAAGWTCPNMPDYNQVTEPEPTPKPEGEC